jgi:RNA polymerase sigma-70 factor (ECF subfamily)
MQAAGKGDMQAFERLVIRHQSTAWNVAVRYIGDASEAEDLVQEAFLRILNAAERYVPTAAFRTYLYRILTRLCIDHVRKKRPVPFDPLPQIRAPGLPASERIERMERERAIQAALGALPPKYRIVIVLRYFEGLGTIEIARSLNTTPKAVERLLARARKRLEPALMPLIEVLPKESEGDSGSSSV